MDYLRYPRVTKILELTEDPEKMAGLLKWQKKMEKIHGIEGAKRERQSILQNGTNTHFAIEKYLSDDPLEEGIDISPLLPLLNTIKSQSSIMIIENRLYCHDYKFQGKPDLVCTLDGLTTIVDWTTSLNLKKRAWVDHKFIQAGAYAIAMEAEKLLQIEQLAVVVYVAGCRRYQLFTTDPEEEEQTVKFYKDAFLSRLTKFRLMPAPEPVAP